MRPAGGNHLTLRKYAENVWDISTAHFDPDRARNEALRKQPVALSSILVAGSTYSRAHLKERLFKEGLKERRCEQCGQGELWRGRRMALILDHVNGIANDHRLENLQVVCPNCAATLPTHCGRQNRLERIPRECLYCGSRFGRPIHDSVIARALAPCDVRAPTARGPSSASSCGRPTLSYSGRSKRWATPEQDDATGYQTTRFVSGCGNTRRSCTRRTARTNPRWNSIYTVSAPIVLILAAGQGTRMRSKTPKVLHELCGRPMVLWPVAAARAAGAGRVVVVDSPARALEGMLPEGVELAVQPQPNGTGGAVVAAMAALDEAGEQAVDPAAPVLVLSGDVPLLSAEAISESARRARARRRGGDDGEHDPRGSRGLRTRGARRERRGGTGGGDEGPGRLHAGRARDPRGEHGDLRVRRARAAAGAAAAERG